jgi:hypothetical protein
MKNTYMHIVSLEYENINGMDVNIYTHCSNDKKDSNNKG